MPDAPTDLIEALSEFTGLPLDEITGDLRFRGLEGWSSSQALRLFVSLEARLRIRLDLRRFLACETVQGLAALTAEAAQAR
jgi:acyl carrier protein